jgi:hypothetical protein
MWYMFPFVYDAPGMCCLVACYLSYLCYLVFQPLCGLMGLSYWMIAVVFHSTAES